ncbi:MAG: PorV/PorQ family protein [bacterium]
MRKWKVVWLTVFILVGTPVSAKHLGFTGAQFLKLPTSARAVGMGEAFCGVGDDINTIYYNPSGLSLIKGSQITFMHTRWFQDIKYEYLGYSRPTNWGVFGIGGMHLYMGSMDRLIETGENPGDYQKDGIFTSSDTALILSLANRLPGKVYVGGNLKLIYQINEDEAIKAYAFDLGMLYQIREKISLGLCLQNIGPEVKFIEAEDPLPLNLKVGVAYKLLNNRFLLAQDINLLIEEGRLDGSFGAEYWPKDMFSLRAGYRTGFSHLESGINGGLGFKWGGFRLDYSYTPYGQLGDTHRASILWSNSCR